MASLDGIIHVHSTYSDGELTLAELRDALRGDGYRFVCMADHAEAFDTGKVERYLAECAALSDSEFFFVPGLEFECERRLHIVGYGCTRLAPSTNPEKVIAHIGSAGGLAVIAHPPDVHFAWLDNLPVRPHGLEVWNSKYDGRYAPRPSTFELLRRWQTGATPVRAFYGVDLHWRKQFRGLGCRVFAASPDGAGVLGALASDRYAGVYGTLLLPPSGEVDPVWLAQAGRRNRRYSGFRRLVKGAKRLLDKAGLRVPPALKAEIRRWF